MVFATEHDRIHNDFVRDLRHDASCPTLQTPDEYTGQSVVKLCCSQHAGLTPYQQKKVTAQWAAFLRSNRLPLREVQVCTRINQAVFDALCSQSSIQSLRIKWLACDRIDAIKNCTHLKKLFIEWGGSLRDLTPLTELTELEVLILGETTKISDYSVLQRLRNLKVLGICAYQTHYRTTIKMESDRFLLQMPNLAYVDLLDARLTHSNDNTTDKR